MVITTFIGRFSYKLSEQERRNSGLEGYRKRGIQERKDSGLEGFRTGGIN